MNSEIQQLLDKVERINQSVIPALDAWKDSLHYVGIPQDSPWYLLGELFIEH